MFDELLFTLFLIQVGIVAAITACFVGAMYLFYAEIIALNRCDTEKLLEASAGPLGEREQEFFSTLF